jgi:hypothetical protein
LKKFSAPLQDAAAAGADSDGHASQPGADLDQPSPEGDDDMNRSESPRAWLAVRTVAAMALSAIAATLIALAPARAGAAPRPPAGGQAEAPPATVLEQRAIEAFLARRFAEAYGRFAELADQGHAPSAWMALMLVSNGPAQFGADWSATPGQLQRWNALATRHAQERSVRIPVHDRGE